MFPPKPFDSLEGLDAFRFFFKNHVVMLHGSSSGTEIATTRCATTLHSVYTKKVHTHTHTERVYTMRLGTHPCYRSRPSALLYIQEEGVLIVYLYAGTFNMPTSYQ